MTPTTKTKTKRNCSDVPAAARAELTRLQGRYRQLLSLLPTDPVAVNSLDEVEFGMKLIDWELVSAEMMSICNAQMKIIAALNE